MIDSCDIFTTWNVSKEGDLMTQYFLNHEYDLHIFIDDTHLR